MNNHGLLAKLHTKLSWKPLFFYLILFVFLSWTTVVFLQQGWNAISYPYQLDYGEGPVLDQAVRLFNSQSIYRTDLSTPPFVVNIYPPIYIVAQLPFINLFGPAFWYGRAMSFISILAIALLIILTLHEFLGNWIGSMVGGLTFLAIPYIVHWSHLFRIDALALLLTWGALFLIVRWPKARWSLSLAILLLAASIYTRQTYLLAGPLTVFCWLWAQSGWKRALSFTGLLISLVTGIFIILNWVTAGGFLFNTITILGEHTISLDTIWYFTQEVSKHLPFLLIAAGILVGIQWSRRSENPSYAFIIPYLLGSLVSALTIGKTGSNVNYLMEFSAALSFATAMFVARLGRWPWLQILSLVLLTAQIYSMGQWLATDYYPSRLAEPHAESPQLMRLIHQADGPVLTDEYIGLLLLDHRPVTILPFDFTVLAKNGMWDQQPFLDMLDQREFGLIIIYDPSGSLVRQRWTKQMLDHIKLNYEQVDSIADNDIYTRRP